nr:biogenesis of lysosome-related organelles complex 1 subunit 5-like isoform X3 [Cherax quadricarinatus]
MLADVNNMAAAASDVNEVFSRLFDHRPFLRGEIEFFKKEFEEKRGDREVEQLFRSLELITEIKEGQIEKIVNSSDDNLPRTIADVQVALHMCEDTLDTESKFNCRLQTADIKHLQHTQRRHCREEIHSPPHQLHCQTCFQHLFQYIIPSIYLHNHNHQGHHQ